MPPVAWRETPTPCTESYADYTGPPLSSLGEVEPPLQEEALGQVLPEEHNVGLYKPAGIQKMKVGTHSYTHSHTHTQNARKTNVLLLIDSGEPRWQTQQKTMVVQFTTFRPSSLSLSLSLSLSHTLSLTHTHARARVHAHTRHKTVQESTRKAWLRQS